MEPPARDLVHVFHAAAFVENLSLKDLAAVYPEARRRAARARSTAVDGRGRSSSIRSAPSCFATCRRPRASASSSGCARARPGLTAATVIEELTVREDPGREPDVADGALTLDQLTPDARQRRRADRRPERGDGVLRADRRGDVRAHRPAGAAAGEARDGVAADAAAAPVHRRRDRRRATRCSRSCTCSTSPTRPGTTRG